MWALVIHLVLRKDDFMPTEKSDIVPAYIGPFTIRLQTKTPEQLQKTIINAHKKCERELRKLLPLPDDKVTNDPIRRPFSQLKREREKAYAQVFAIEDYKEALNGLLTFIEWLHTFINNPQDPWYNVPIYRIQQSTFEEFKNANMFYRDYDGTQLKIGIYIPREKEHKTVELKDLQISERIQKGVILIYLAPYPNHTPYKFRNPHTVGEFSINVSCRISAIKARLNGERKPVASKVSQQNCSVDEARLRYREESRHWEYALRERLAALQSLKTWANKLVVLTSSPEDPWHNIPVHFVRQGTFNKFMHSGKFYRYCSTPHAMIGVAMKEDTYETRNLLLNQRRTRQCFMPSEITEHERFSDVVLVVCIPPIPKWPILKWN